MRWCLCSREPHRPPHRRQACARVKVNQYKHESVHTWSAPPPSSCPVSPCSLLFSYCPRCASLSARLILDTTLPHRPPAHSLRDRHENLRQYTRR
ncbi:hypothetical protein E2C01_092773 [Portunus trituberculatus]|uniref:Uncharacterized protein n=1 Tax=Portunus trituberculatus TaxID=210409 RepID=A0A5B7JT34_PORTR|nr:hypothetical protein [Portunus trituberculatus]